MYDHQAFLADYARRSDPDYVSAFPISKTHYPFRRAKIREFLNVSDENAEFYRLHWSEQMSTYEIAEKLKAAGILLSERSILRAITKIGPARSPADSFRLAAKKGRVHWALKDPSLKSPKRQLSFTTRLRILERDGSRCVKCGRTAKCMVLEVDHIIAKSQGGTDADDNLQTLCHECNSEKRVLYGEK